jgi:hypothetical protein
MYIETFTRLHVCHLTPEFHERTCNYWYTVTDNNTPLTAFHDRSALDLWMDERGLSLVNPIPDRGDMSYITGTYRRCSHMAKHALDNLDGLHTRCLSNGDYTAAIITDDPDGIKTVHYLNPNLPRVVFDYFESDKIYKGSHNPGDENIDPRAALFIGVYPGGIVYADREHCQQDGDYKRLAFLSYSTLALDIEPDAPAHFRRLIEEDAATLQANRGEKYSISECGQYVILGQ